MFSLKKKLSIQAIPKEDHDLKERLFFHDIINHTHGLVLFLNQKEMQKEKIDMDEIKMISNEIKTLQSLIRDHYDFKHKNLVQTIEWVPYSYVKVAFDNMSHTYLQNKKVTVVYDFEGNNGEDNLIYYPSFYRILNNLVKNISESNSTHVHFEFKLNDHGLEMVSKNVMLINNENELPEHLARVILNDRTPKSEGLGLESIHHLAEENGGTFSFEITDGAWINRLYLPTSRIISDKIPA